MYDCHHVPLHPGVYSRTTCLMFFGCSSCRMRGMLLCWLHQEVQQARAGLFSNQNDQGTAIGSHRPLRSSTPGFLAAKCPPPPYPC